jgi:hypothetical protein
LTAPNGDWLALRKPLGSGSLIIIATAYPLTNAGLRDPDTARFVFRTLLGSQAPSTVVAFDESHYGGLAVADPADGIVEHLLFTTPAGRGVLLAAALVFLYLLFGSRRLGPALPGVNPGEHSRTMYEHVQMLAGLYRRSRQLRFARQYFARKLAHDAARGLGLDPRSAEDPEVFALELAARNRSDAGQDSRLAHAITRVASARSEADLIAAVRIAETAASALPRAGTLR